MNSVALANRFRFAVFGLGNPGREFANTRHNLGFMVVDRVAERLGVDWHDSRSTHCIHGSTQRRTWRKRADATPESIESGDECVLYLVKPQTFMNRSGDGVRSFCTRFKVPLRNILIVSDDLDLPIGKIRMRQVGRSGGQKGIESVERALGSDRFDRLKVGIGAPNANAAQYVLAKIPQHEVAQFDEPIANAVDAIGLWLERGALDAMNRFNKTTERAANQDE